MLRHLFFLRYNSSMSKLKKCIQLTFPVCLGYVPLGIAFGMLLSDAGYGLFWSFLMASTIFAGSMQFVMVALLSSSTSLVSVALLTFLVQSRHLFYGLSLVERYRHFPLLKRLYLIFSLTDETYSLVSSMDEKDDDLLFMISLLNHLYWIAGCVLGSLLKNLIPFNTAGFEFAMTALFVCIVVEQYCAHQDHFPFWTGLLCGVVCLVVLGPDQFLLVALCLSVLILVVKNQRRTAT